MRKIIILSISSVFYLNSIFAQQEKAYILEIIPTDRKISEDVQYSPSSIRLLVDSSIYCSLLYEQEVDYRKLFFNSLGLAEYCFDSTSLFQMESLNDSLKRRLSNKNSTVLNRLLDSNTFNLDKINIYEIKGVEMISDTVTLVHNQFGFYNSGVSYDLGESYCFKRNFLFSNDFDEFILIKKTSLYFKFNSFSMVPWDTPRYRANTSSR